jgi:hypothetical protein
MAQSDQEMPPEQSAAKAKQVLQQVIAALGGQAYLNVRDSECEGRFVQFEASGEHGGFTPYRDAWLLPDKNRTEYINKGVNTIAGFIVGIEGFPFVAHGGVLTILYNGQEGWILDKGGVSNQPEDAVKDFNEQIKSGMNNMLRSRMNEPGVEIRYAGTDIIDLREAEWISFTDADHRDLRLAVDKSTHLPMRWVVTKRDPETRIPTEITTTYAQFIPMDGVKTPLTTERFRDDRKLSQVFVTGCKFNSNLPPEQFTRAWLEQHAAEATRKGYKDSKTSK